MACPVVRYRAISRRQRPTQRRTCSDSRAAIVRSPRGRVDGRYAALRGRFEITGLSGAQLTEQCLRLLQIERVKAFGEPAVDRSEKIVGLIPLVLIVWRLPI